MNVVVLASGNGTTFGHLVKKLPDFGVRVSALVASEKALGAIEKAKLLGVPTSVGLDDQKLRNKLRELKPDLIVLAGYLKKIPSEILSDWPNKIINVHPSLLPKYGGQGMYGRRVHEAVIKNKDTSTGATVHFVDEVYDHGPHILQKSIQVKSSNSADDVEAAVKSLEKDLLVDAIRLIFKIKP